MKRGYTLPLLVLVFVVLTAGIVAAGGLLYRHQRESCKTEAEYKLASVADLKVGELSLWRKEHLKDGGSFYKNNAFSALVRRSIERPQDLPLQEELRTWIGHFQVAEEYDQVTLLDATCHPWMSFPDRNEPLSSATAEKARQVLRSGQMTFADFYSNEYSKKIYLCLFVPIFDGSSGARPLGVLRLRIDPEVYLYPFIQRWPTPSETAETLLIRREGNEAVFLNELKFQKNTPLTLRVSLDSTDLPAVKAALNQEGIVEGVDYRGVPVLAAVRAVPDSPWFLVAKIDFAEVYAPMRKQLWLTVLFMGVLLFGLAAAVGFVWRQQHFSLYREMYEAERMYRAIVESSADGILAVDLETKMFKYPNPALCRMLGYTEQELRTMNVADIHPKDAFQNVLAELESLARGDKSLAMNIPCLRKDGAVVDADINTIQVTLDGRKCLVGVFRDTTGRKQTEKALRESEEWYKTLFVEALDGICLVDAETGLIIDCNQALTALVDRDKAELIGQPQTILHPPAEDSELFSPTFKQHLGEKAGQILDTQVLTRTGEIKEVSIVARTLNLAGKRVMQGLFRDITDRKRAEEALRQFNQQLESAAGQVQALMTGVIQKSIFTNRFDNPSLTPCWEAMKCENTACPSYRNHGNLRCWEVAGTFCGGKIQGRFAQKLDSCSLCEVYQCARANKVMDLGETFNVMIAILNDRHEQLRETNQKIEAAIELANRMAVQAESANRVKSEFLANMSHEIRTPITAILGYADIMLEEDIGRATRERVEVIKRNGEHLLGLVNDILDLSKVEAGKMQIEPIRCSLFRLLAEIVSLMRVRADEKRLKLETDVADSLPETILTDPLRLRQVLVNLVGNAIKFTDQGKVCITARLIEVGDLPRLRFDVTDTGIGMNEEQVGRLFRAFSQVDNSSARKFGGTGLGLCISKLLTEALGGDIEVRSEPGKGSTFSVTIDPGPLDGIRLIRQNQGLVLQPPPIAASAAESKIELHGRILLAEDGLDNQRLIGFILKKAGAQVTVVENGQLAVEAALAAREAGRPFEVILMDMQMPIMDGYAATRELREKGYTAPIIALTAHAMAQDRRQCLDAGCDDYATKPIDRRKLFATVALWAARSRTNDDSPKPTTPESNADITIP